MSQITKKDILDRLKALITNANELKINNGKIWWRIGSHKNNNDEIAMSLNEQIDVSDEDMARVMGPRWTGQFKDPFKPISKGFKHGSHSATLYVSVCAANDSSASPTTNSRMNPNSAIRRKVDVGLKEVIKTQQQRLKRANNDKPSPTNTGPAAATKISPHMNM